MYCNLTKKVNGSLYVVCVSSLHVHCYIAFIYKYMVDLQNVCLIEQAQDV